MKFFAVLWLVSGGLVTTGLALANPVEEIKGAVSVKHKNLLLVKTEKNMKGATIQIYGSNGDLVATQKLNKRKLIIDFCDVKAGTYIVRILKGDQYEELLYTRGV